MATEYSKIKRHGGKRGPEEARKAKKSSNSAAGAAEIAVDKPLTDLQKAFVKAWAEGESITSACVKVGYSDHKFAYRLARMPNVLALKAEYAAKYEEAAQMTRKRVMDGLLEAIDMAKLMSEPATMISGWREVGKMCGYYAPVEQKIKIDVTGNVVMDRLNSLSDAELLNIITQGAANASTPALDYDPGVGEDDE